MEREVAAAWDGVKVLEVSTDRDLSQHTNSGEAFTTTIKIDANGLADDLALELVIDKVHDNQESRVGSVPFEVVSKDGNIVTFQLADKLRDRACSATATVSIPATPNSPPSGLRIRTLDLIDRYNS